MASKRSSSTTPKQDLYLIVHEERRDGYFHLYARVTTDKRENGHRYPHGVDDRYDNGPLYSGLRASCQGDASSRSSQTREQAVYGYGEVEYRDVFSIDLREARRMTKTLEKVARGLEKLGETRGYARSYGEFLGRLAEVLGCQGMAFQRNQKSASITGEKYRWTSIGDGVNEANNTIYQWQRELQEQAGVQA